MSTVATAGLIALIVTVANGELPFTTEVKSREAEESVKYVETPDTLPVHVASEELEDDEDERDEDEPDVTEPLELLAADVLELDAPLPPGSGAPAPPPPPPPPPHATRETQASRTASLVSILFIIDDPRVIPPQKCDGCFFRPRILA